MTSSPAHPPSPAPQDHPKAAAIRRATGSSFDAWVQRLDEAGARGLGHAAIARTLVDDWGVGDWWAQSVAVAYEQHIGRREVGQSCAGDFGVSASRTIDGDMDTVRERWDRFMSVDRRQQCGLSEGRLTDSEKWRYWRCDAEDGSTLSVNITAKPSRTEVGTHCARSSLAIAHKGIATGRERDIWKSMWKSTLNDFTTWIEENRAP